MTVLSMGILTVQLIHVGIGNAEKRARKKTRMEK